MRTSRTLLLSRLLRSLNQLALLGQLWLPTTLLLIPLALSLQRSRILRQLLNIRQKLRLARNILPKHLWHLDPVFALVVLEDAAEGTFGGAEGGVEGVDVRFLEGGVGLFFLAETGNAVLAERILGRGPRG